MIERINYTDERIDEIIGWINNGLPDDMAQSTKYKWQKKLEKFEVRNGKLFVDFKEVIRNEDKLDILKENYNVPTGWQTFYKKISDMFWNISANDVREFVNKIEYKQLHRPQHDFPVLRPVIAKAPLKIFQIDLIDMSKYWRTNQGYKWIFSCIDLFTKYAMAIPLKSKEGEETIRDGLRVAFGAMGVPKIVQSDNGPEFKNAFMTELLNEEDFKFITSEAYRPQSQGQVERFNRTIKSWLQMMMTKNGDRRWKVHLDDVMETYNNKIHSTTGYPPEQLNGTQSQILIKRVRKRIEEKGEKFVSSNRQMTELKKDDSVRVSLMTVKENRKKALVMKKLNVNWSNEIYKVARVFKSTKPYLGDFFQIKDDNQRYSRKYKRSELLKVDPDIIVDGEAVEDENDDDENDENDGNDGNDAPAAVQPNVPAPRYRLPATTFLQDRQANPRRRRN